MPKRFHQKEMYLWQFCICSECNQGPPQIEAPDALHQIGYIQGLWFSKLGFFAWNVASARIWAKMERLDRHPPGHCIIPYPLEWLAGETYKSCQGSTAGWPTITIAFHPRNGSIA
jgi:hypothetical protein